MKSSLNLRAKLLMQFILIGTIPLAVMSIIAYSLASVSLVKSALNKLASVGIIKKDAIERYFQSINSQIQSFSENQMVIDAARNLKLDFAEISADVGDAELEKMKESLHSYYVGPFSEEYRKQNKGKEPKINETLEQLSKQAVVSQYHYISKSRNPLGSKHLLDKASDGSAYSESHNRLHPIIRSYLEKFGYYDIFIADAQNGNIIYSVFKELDFGTSLLTGPYKDTNFADVFRMANASTDKDFVKLVDFKQYMPSFEAPASFIASPIFDNGEKIAVAIFQMPIDRVNAIMGQRSGMGESGETILVGPDQLMRSDSYLDQKNRNVIASYRHKDKGSVDLPIVAMAISGKSGSGHSTGYLGQEILSSYTPVSILGLTWALIAKSATSEALKPVYTIGIWMGVVGALSIFFNLIFGAFVGRNIANPILSVANHLEQNALNVAGASKGLAGSSQQLSKLASQQASSIEETAASIEEISAMVKNNVEQAEKSSTLSEQVKEVADHGNQSMQKLIISMKEIISSNQKIQELVKVIGEIGEKTSVIDEIVFQTKLLSFNASVEAERAGEHGRGFAVVAQEVGNLAQMSGKAASEIANMVKSSIRNAEEITSENKGKVESGNLLVLETAKYLEAITKNAEHLLKQAEQIVGSSKEQSEGIAQVNEAMSQLDNATQQNSGTAEETSNSSNQLSTQAEQLKSNVNNLLVLVNGHSNRKPTENVVNIESVRKSAPLAAVPTASHSIKKVVGDGLVSGGSSEDSWDEL